MPVLPALWPLPALLAVVVAALFAAVQWGIRRGRLPTTPTCRRCGYDVSHRPAGVDRCSECGADLTTAGAIATGRGRLRPRVAGPAVAVAAVAFGLFVSAAATFPYRAWLATNGPLSWVIAGAGRDHSPAGDVYRNVWATRVKPTVPPELIDNLLDVQADAGVPWTGTWDGPLLTAFQRDALTPAQRERYVRGLFGTLSIVVRPTVRVGDPLVVRVTSAGRRGSTGPLACRAVVAARADGPAVPDPHVQWVVGTPVQAFKWEFSPHEWCPQGLTPGRHRVAVAVARDVVSRQTPSSGGSDSISPTVLTAATVEVDVLPADAVLATARPDPSQAERVARAVDLHVYHWHDGRVFAVVQLLPTDVDRAFRVATTVGGTERTIGTIAAAAGGEATTNAVYVPRGDDHLHAVTVTLSGDPTPTRDTMGQSSYWPGRITYADVPVQPWADYARDGQRFPQPTTRPFRAEPG